MTQEESFYPGPHWSCDAPARPALGTQDTEQKQSRCSPTNRRNLVSTLCAVTQLEGAGSCFCPTPASRIPTSTVIHRA